VVALKPDFHRQALIFGENFLNQFLDCRAMLGPGFVIATLPSRDCVLTDSDPGRDFGLR
jgi:hypothetical protein